jgi:hypothetical protein
VLQIINWSTWLDQDVSKNFRIFKRNEKERRHTRRGKSWIEISRWLRGLLGHVNWLLHHQYFRLDNLSDSRVQRLCNVIFKMGSISIEQTNNKQNLIGSTYLSDPRSRYILDWSVISCVTVPSRSDRPCIPWRWKAKILSDRQTKPKLRSKSVNYTLIVRRKK